MSESASLDKRAEGKRAEGAYGWLRGWVQRLLRVSARAPAPLPGHGGGLVQVVRACPSYLRYRMFFWRLYALAWGTGVAAASVVLLAIGPWYLLLVVPLVGFAVVKAAILYAATRLDYEFRWYVLTDRSLLIRQGVWTVREICLTFANVQNVYVKQGPLQRWFGFSNVEVDTAGGGGKKKEEKEFDPHRAVLRGLADPQPVRDLILDLLRRHRAAGLGDPDDHVAAPQAATPGLNPALLDEILAEARLLRTGLEARHTP